jgi:hypothetical protein
LLHGYLRNRAHGSRCRLRRPLVFRSLAEFLDFLPDDTEQAVRVNATVQMAGGMLLA